MKEINKIRSLLLQIKQLHDNLLKNLEKNDNNFLDILKNICTEANLQLEETTL